MRIKPISQDAVRADWDALLARKGGRRVARPTAKAALADSPEALVETLTDDRFAQVIADKGKFKEFLNEYKAAFERQHADVGNESRAQMQQMMSQMLSEQRDQGYQPAGYSGDGKVIDFASAQAKRAKTRSIMNRGTTFQVPNPYNQRNTHAAELDSVFSNSGEFFQAVWSSLPGITSSEEMQTRLAKVNDQTSSWRNMQNSFGSIVPDAGGFLIPEVLRADLMMIALESAVTRPRATVIPMESLRVPIPAVDSTTNVGSIFGGIVGYWLQEAAQLTETQATFMQIVLDAKKLTLYSEIPNELIADAPAFSGFFDKIFPQAITWFEDLAFFSGTGAGEPEGWTLSPATVHVDPAVSSQFAFSDITSAYSRMLPGSLGDAVWICAPDAFPQLAQMTFGTGQFPALIPIGGAGDTFQLSLLGRPVIISEKNAALGSNGALSFVDLNYYLIGDRQSMLAASSPHYKFQNDKLAFRMIERVDGRPWLRSAITPANGSTNTLSPFVQIDGVHT